MALIKCTGCGHDISDKASACPHCGCQVPQVKNNFCKECGEQISDDATICPNCGCPTDNDMPSQQVAYKEEPKGKKWWIWVLIIALLCLIGGGVLYFLPEKAKSVSEASTDEKKDSVDAKNAIVEITPEFIKALEVYDELAPFNEGYAAVRRGKKWGYINTKGEEVISCSFDYADFFSNGLAAVMKNEKWGYIDTTGKVIIPFTYEPKPTPFSEGMAGVNKDGKWGWINKTGEIIIPIGIEADEVGIFSEGLVFVCMDFGDRFSFINKQGKEVFGGEMDRRFLHSGYRGSLETNDFPMFDNGFVYISTDYNDDYNFVKYDKQGKKYESITLDKLPLYRKFETDDYDKSGIKKGNEIIIPAIYDMVGGAFGNLARLSNGVFLVGIYEYGDGEEGTMHYGYANLYGKDTFTKELRDRCNKSKEDAEYLYVEDETDYSDTYVNSDWLQGRWFADSNGYSIEVIIEGDHLTYKINGQIDYDGTYEYNGEMLIYDNASAFWPVDNAQQVLTYNSKPMIKGRSSSTDNSPYSSNSNSTHKSYRFSTAHDVIGYLSDKTFYNGNRSLRIRPDGIWLNDYCATGAPNVEQFESWKALIRAFTATGQRLSFLIDPIHGQIIDASGDVFSLR